MEARATARYVRVTPRKVNQVLDLLRGQDVEEALTSLSFSKKHVAKNIEKTMRSAVANAIQLDSKVDVEDLYVKEALVGPGPIMKRWLPRAQGRATPLYKRTSHITIILADKESRKTKGRGKKNSGKKVSGKKVSAKKASSKKASAKKAGAKKAGTKKAGTKKASAKKAGGKKSSG